MNEPAPPCILVVEDEQPIRDGLGDALRFRGWRAELAADGEVGLRAGLAGGHDLVLLDVMMPGIDGFTVCTRLRAAIPSLAICMLTAKGSDEDVLKGFACGCDDFVAKPFSVKLLLARVEALLRRGGRLSSGSAQAGPLTLDYEGLRAGRDGRWVALTRRDLDVLACLARHGAAVVPRQTLLQEVWGYGRLEGVETRCVDMHLVKLRRKLAGLGPGGEEIVTTVRGGGYRLGEGPCVG